MAAMSASNFDGRLTHTDGLYFAVTVFSTVGFGDITASFLASRSNSSWERSAVDGSRETARGTSPRSDEKSTSSRTGAWFSTPRSLPS